MALSHHMEQGSTGGADRCDAAGGQGSWRYGLCELGGQGLPGAGGAFAAHGANAQTLLQFAHGHNAIIDGGADIAVPNGIADTDVHGFSIPC